MVVNVFAGKKYHSYKVAHNPSPISFYDSHVYLGNGYETPYMLVKLKS